MRKIWALVAVGTLTLALAIVALRRQPAGERAPDVPSAQNAPTVPDPPACPVDAKKANLDFTLKDIDGRAVRLADYRGRVLLLDFWATWCGPCKVEIPGFVDLYSRYKSKGFEIVGVVVLDEFAKAKPFARQFKMNYTIVDGNDRQDLEDAFGPMPGLPTSFMIARDGRICSTHIGLPSHAPSDRPVGDVVRDIFEAEIKALL